MRKTTRIFLCIAACLALLTACAANAEERQGEAQGYGGTLRVAVTMDGDRLIQVRVLEHHETDGVGTRAIDALPEAMAKAGSAQVDDISGATVTSQALKAAVADALGTALPSASSAGAAMPTAGDFALPEGAHAGVGMAATGRLGPGQDSEGNPVYSINVVFASGIFDTDGRILHVLFDQLETATPNYDGATMPHFGGWPGQGGWPLWDDESGSVTGKSDDTEDAFLAEVSAWTTKRQRGDSYQLGTGSWANQMDAYQTLMTGKTVDEVEAWFARCFSDESGRPLRANATSEKDQAKYAALTEEEKSTLADVTSSATMSLRDNHGDLLLALRRAWENASNP